MDSPDILIPADGALLETQLRQVDIFDKRNKERIIRSEHRLVDTHHELIETWTDALLRRIFRDPAKCSAVLARAVVEADMPAAILPEQIALLMSAHSPAFRLSSTGRTMRLGSGFTG